MTQEEKDLLLKDLCARLPYGVKVSAIGWDKPIDLMELDINRLFSSSLDTPKPYLRPMASMTEEERGGLRKFCETQPQILEDIGVVGKVNSIAVIEWLNAHHFDYRGLIEKGLALEAPKDMYKTE